ncbi:MAG TPA: kelch repeat-containing protein [Bacteroidia bacterium]|nr:kelch repeat-containing protein [Bacteroidia bacterium]
MIKNLTLLSVCLLLTCCMTSMIFAQGVWTKKTSIGNSDATVRAGAAGVTVNNNGYVLFGSFYGNLYRNDGYRYDEANNKWIRIADLPASIRSGAVAFAINGKIYAGAGYNGTYIGDFWEYNPAADAWTQKANTPGPGRSGAARFAINGKGYISTGGNSMGNTSDTWEYDAVANSWTQKADWPTNGRSGSNGFVINNKFYGGSGSVAGVSTATKDFWMYDPVTDIWTQKADYMGGDRTGFTAFKVGQYGYAGCGMNNVVIMQKDFYRYDPANNNWMQIADFPGSARGATAFSTSTKGYVGAGSDNHSNLSDYYAYDPASGTWSQIADCGGAERYYDVAFAAGQHVIVGSGLGGLSDLKTSYWAFDTTNNEWLLKASLPIMKKNGVAFSIGTKGYVTLGATLYNYSKELWEYDLNTNVFTQKAAFPGTARMNAVAVAANGKGYLGTGRDSTNHVLKDWWQYNPANNTWTQKTSLPGDARHWAAAFAVSNNCFVFAGQDSAGFTYYDDCWKYNPANNTWLQQASLTGYGRASATGFSVKQFGYIVCGIRGSAYYNALFQFQPSTNTWKTKASFPGTIRYGGAGAGLGEKGYFGTGYANYGFAQAPVNDWWEYTPDKITCSVNGSCFCLGATISVDYVCTALTLNAGNQLKLILSDSSGSFANNVNLATVNSTAASGTITAALPSTITGGTHYKVRVSSTNNALTGENSTAYFTVYAVPANPFTSATTAGSATLQWDAVPCAISYTIQYKISIETVWTITTSTVNSKTITGLLPGTNYKWRVRAKCSTNPGVFSKYSSVISFTTAILKEGESYSTAPGEKSLLNIYPNPAADFINLSFLTESPEAEIRIYDINGKLCFQKIIPGDGELVKNTVDLHGFPNGIYSVVVTDRAKQAVHNFVKE